MTYRDPLPDRLYVCASCRSAERAPVLGGQVDCARCGAINTLPDRTGLPTSDAAFQPPPDDPARLQQLAAPRGAAREVSPALHAVLGGSSVQPGREQEALAIWQSLRARSQQGDVMASEDMVMLTHLLVQSPSVDDQLADALRESAYDAAVLLRHKQEQLGHLALAAIAKGERARAQQYLARMAPWPMELEADSDLRVAAAAFATLDGDGQRVLALLGQTKDAIPIAGSLSALAMVLRANACELVGDVDMGAKILRALPDPSVLERVNATFPALHLCARSGRAYHVETTQESARQQAAGAGCGGVLVGLMMLALLYPLAVGILGETVNNWIGNHPFYAWIAGTSVVVGAGIFFSARARRRESDGSAPTRSRPPPAS